MCDAFDLFVAAKFRDFFDHRRFVHLIGDFIDHNGVAIFANFFDPRFGTQNDGAASLCISFDSTRAA